MGNRRSFLQNGLALGAVVWGSTRLFAEQAETGGSHSGMRMDNKRQKAGGPPVAVQTPDVANLPFNMDNGVKEFHLIAEPVKQQILPGRTLDLWGYNGSAPGPTIQINQ